MSELIIPTVHLNGTSREALIDQLCDAFNALSHAQKKMAEAAPNARDYYVQKNPQAYSKAAEQHATRMKKIQEVMRELESIAEGVSDQ